MSQPACRNCGATFAHEARAGRKSTFCSPSCRAEFKASASDLAAKQKRAAVRRAGRQCKHCGVHFRLTQGKEVFCSRSCYLEDAAGERAYVRGLVVRHCSECGAEFAPRHPLHKTCGDRCRKRREASRHKRPDVNLSMRVRSQMRRAVREAKGGRKWESLVGYSLSELVKHIERRFLPGMTWANVKEWHIDHIRPLSSFSFSSFEDPEFREAWALSNLQPLWAIDNLRKGASYASAKKAASTEAAVRQQAA